MAHMYGIGQPFCGARHPPAAGLCSPPTSLPLPLTFFPLQNTETPTCSSSSMALAHIYAGLCSPPTSLSSQNTHLCPSAKH
eukprot:1156596-Pelagomonas_calceolata.AAC.3